MTADRHLRIAMLGIRGIPANYGGFETCVDEIAPRMAARGHDVTVYNRSSHINYPNTTYKGVKLVSLPTIRNKYLDTTVHSHLAALHAIVKRHDAVMVFGVGNSPICALLRAGKLPVMLNVNGLDWKRDKWPRPAKVMLRLSEKLAVRVANITITDSRNVQAYYREHRRVQLDYIPYGASPDPPEMNGAISELGLQPRHYFLYVGRLEPENRVIDIVEASRASQASIPTVIVGDAPYAGEYKDTLRARAANNVVFPGAIYGSGYWELNNHAYTYVFPVLSSGTHPALIEAMACGNCVLVRDTQDNRAVGGDSVRYFSTVDELAALMRWAESEPDEVHRLGQQAAERAKTLYDWERVTEDYLALARKLVESS